MKFMGLELHVVLTDTKPSTEIEIATIPETKKLRIETLEVMTDEDNTSPTIGGYTYSKYPYSIMVKENGITVAVLTPKDPTTMRNLSRFKVDFAFPVEVQGKITAVATALTPIASGDTFNIHAQIVAVEMNREETLTTWRK
ncbi:MAG: hypothetical protein DSY42_09560 [Aquifex sp.]|nr:MAG: hypothetical protein DSY42_09560 [Aquifex sp.]